MNLSFGRDLENMKKIILSLAVILTFCFGVSAQFNFTSSDGTTFSNSGEPDYTGDGHLYYSVKGSQLVIQQVGFSGEKISYVRVINVDINKINLDRFRVSKLGNRYQISLGIPVKWTTYSNSSLPESYQADGYDLSFTSLEAANAFKEKIADNFSQDKKDEEFDKALGDLDLDLDDKPKEKPKSKMPAHLFALLGEGSRGAYQFNRKNMEVWDYKSNDIFKVGKIADSGSELKMLNADESYFTYRVKDGKLYNGNKFLDIELVEGNICKSYNGEKCFSKWQIDRDDEYIYSVFDNGAKRYTQYKIMGEATDEEILLIFAYLEKF